MLALARPRVPKLNLRENSAKAGSDEVEVVWQVSCSQSRLDEMLYIVGSHRQLGDWEARQGIQLNTTASSFPLWSGKSKLPARAFDTQIWWKLVLVSSHDLRWESVKDRCLDLGTPGKAVSCNIYTINVNFGISDGLMPLVTPRYMHPGCDPSNTSTPAIGRTGSRWGSTSTCVPEGEDEASTLEECDTKTSRSQSDESLNAHPVSRVSDAHPAFPSTPLSSHSTRPFSLNAGAFQLGKPESRCEDSYFHCSTALAVADGVGQMVQFARYGMDSAAYATDIMEGVAVALRVQRGSVAEDEVLAEERAESAVAFAADRAVTYGATTACVLMLEGKEAGVANLGDSGFMLLRRSAANSELQIVIRSREQQHRWNAPYQLIRLPPVLIARLKGKSQLDTAADSDRYQVQVQDWDLLLLFTDGLVDNLFEHEILAIVEDCVIDSRPDVSVDDGWAAAARTLDPASIAKALALAAQTRSLDETATVPFSLSSEAQGEYCPGGKTDDITVVAAWVVPYDPAATQKDDMDSTMTIGYPGRGPRVIHLA